MCASAGELLGLYWFTASLARFWIVDREMFAQGVAMEGKRREEKRSLMEEERVLC